MAGQEEICLIFADKKHTKKRKGIYLMSIETIKEKPEMLKIACMKVAREGHEVRVMFDLEQSFVDYIRQRKLSFDFIPIMINEEVVFILECFMELYGPGFMDSTLFKDGKEITLGEYAINEENDVFLSMDWDVIAEHMKPTERQKGGMDMLYYIAFRRFSKVGSCISMVIEQDIINKESSYYS